MVTEFRRSQPWWRVSTTVHVEWGFRSAAAARPGALPLLAVRFAPRLDQRNTAPAGQSMTFPVRVEKQAGAPGRAVSALAVQASFDEGTTWTPVTLRRHGSGWLATVTSPAGATSVSLRAAAHDAGGNTVVQTITRAYLLG